MPIEACLGSINGAGGAVDGTVGFIQLRIFYKGPSQTLPNLH